MNRKRFSTLTNALSGQIWQQYANVESWPNWDLDLEWAQLRGAFALGAKGYLQPKKGPKIPFVISALEQGKFFSSRAQLPLAHLEVMHSLHNQEGQCLILHEISFGGPLGWLFSRLLGSALHESTTQAIACLAKLAEDKV